MVPVDILALIQLLVTCRSKVIAKLSLLPAFCTKSCFVVVTYRNPRISNKCGFYA